MDKNNKKERMKNKISSMGLSHHPQVKACVRPRTTIIPLSERIGGEGEGG